MILSKQELEKQMYQRVNRENEIWVASLLKNGYAAGIESEERQERLNVRLDLSGYRIAIVSVEELEECRFLQSGNEKERQESYALLQFSVKNVLEEALQLEDRKGMLLELEDVLAVIVPSLQESAEELTATLRECSAFFENAFEIRLVTFISAWHREWVELSEGYEEVFQTMTYKNFWGEELEDVLLYQESEEADKRQRHGSFLEQEKKLSNCLLTKNYEEAFSRRLLETKSLPNLKRELHHILEEIVEGQKAGNKEEPKWLAEVKRYIEENYQDYSLNISHIANQFHMSTSHLGSRFRTLTGISMLDYIHTIRLQAAKKLLLEGWTVKACAEETGYGDAKTFNRAFKRYEGITPGQYKECERSLT